MSRLKRWMLLLSCLSLISWNYCSVSGLHACLCALQKRYALSGSYYGYIHLIGSIARMTGITNMTQRTDKPKESQTVQLVSMHALV